MTGHRRGVASARPSATVVLMRDGPEGLEVLLLRRVREAGFVPGAFVFPGGTVDPADSDPAVLDALDGVGPDEAATRLGLSEGRPPAIAHYVAAVREAFEETGILLGRTADGSVPDSAAGCRAVRDVRRDLMDDRISFAQALDRLGCRLAAGSMAYIAHWITPRSEPRRFDTRFFAARVPDSTEALVDPREMTEARWVSPQLAAEQNADGRLPMILPTIRTLERLGSFASPEEVLATLRLESVPTILPTRVTKPSDIGLRSPVDS